jgi:hypothetical protein
MAVGLVAEIRAPDQVLEPTHSEGSEKFWPTESQKES